MVGGGCLPMRWGVWEALLCGLFRDGRGGLGRCSIKFESFATGAGCVLHCCVVGSVACCRYTKCEELFLVMFRKEFNLRLKNIYLYQIAFLS